MGLLHLLASPLVWLLLIAVVVAALAAGAERHRWQRHPSGIARCSCGAVRDRDGVIYPNGVDR